MPSNNTIVIFRCRKCKATGFWYGSGNNVYEPGGCLCKANRHTEIHVMVFPISDVNFSSERENNAYVEPITSISGYTKSFSSPIPHLNDTNLFAPFSRRSPNA